MTVCIESPYNVALLHIPKTAGTSIDLWMRENFSTYEMLPQHVRFEVLRHQLKGKKMWCFTVVRNPYDWLVSNWEFKRTSAEDRIRELIKNNGKPKSSIEQHQLRYQLDLIQKYEFGFEWYVRSHNLETLHDYIFDNNKCVDHILKFESLTKDFEYIQTILNCNQPLPITNRNRNKVKKHWKEYYTSGALIDYVTKKHERDLEMFNYKFD